MFVKVPIKRTDTEPDPDPNPFFYGSAELLYLDIIKYLDGCIIIYDTLDIHFCLRELVKIVLQNRPISLFD